MAFTLGLDATSATELVDTIDQRGSVLTVDVDDQRRVLGSIGIDNDGDSFEPSAGLYDPNASSIAKASSSSESIEFVVMNTYS